LAGDTRLASLALVISLIVLTVVVLSVFYVVLPRALYGFMAFYGFVNFVWMDLCSQRASVVKKCIERSIILFKH